jgi:hypothetical protein
MTQAKMAKLAADLERAESRLLRAITRWMKLRAQVKRAGAKLDRGLADKLEGLPGALDVREFGIKPKPWPKGGSNRVMKVKLKGR